MTEPPGPGEGMHVCGACSGTLVYPVRWECAGPRQWAVLLRCPECEHWRQGVFSNLDCDAFDDHLDAGTRALVRWHKKVVRLVMGQEIERFVAALNAENGVLPEDFGLPGIAV